MKRLPRWNSFVKVRELKGVDKRITRVFGNKKPQIIAGSFFALAAAGIAVVQGNAGTLGIFSVVMILWPLLSSTEATPQLGLLVYVALAWQTMSLSQMRAAAQEKRREKKKKAAEAAQRKAAEKAEGEVENAKKGSSDAAAAGREQAKKEPKKDK